MEIRKCRHDDIPSVIKIESLSFKYHYPSSIFYNYLDRNFYVAEEDGKVVGYAIGDARRHLIVSIAVHPDYRRRGIGTKLMESVLKNMHGYAILQVRMSNNEAIKFYKKLGFIEKEVLQSYYIDGEDAILMFKNLD